MPGYIEIIEGTPYTVPSGKLLVVTAMGTKTPHTKRTVCKLLVDSAEVYRTGIMILSMQPIAEALVAESGSVVEPITVTPGQPNCKAWGRLEDTEQN